MKTVPENDIFFTTSCILGALNPTTELLALRLFDVLGIRYATSAGPHAQSTCCTGILNHGAVITPESTLLVVARIWSVAREAGFSQLSTACVTSFGTHLECLELLRKDPELTRRVAQGLQAACGRPLSLPTAIVHTSDMIWRYRNELAQRFRYRLVHRKTGSPLRVVEHVGCHYAKLFPEDSLGGTDHCDVLSALIRAWGGTAVDYPERRMCCGMGFRHCMIRPNRAFTFTCCHAKLKGMAPFEPDLILTNCPGCNQFLDRAQHAVEALTGISYGIPVLSYAELAGLLMGWDPYDAVGIQGKTAPVEPLLVKLGIPHDPRRAYLKASAPLPQSSPEAPLRPTPLPQQPAPGPWNRITQQLRNLFQ